MNTSLFFSNKIRVYTSVNILNIFAEQRRAIQTLFMLTFCLVFGLLTLSHPTLEWDTIAYVANAKQVNDVQPIEELRQTVYSELKNAVPASDYARLTTERTRRIISENNEAFGQTIKYFYDARVIYISVLAVLMEFGMEPFYATYFISTICAIVSILLLATLLPFPLPYGLSLALPFVVVSNGLLDVARLSTPDSMATMVTIAMYWCLMRRSYVLLALFPLSIFVRTDMILLAPLFLGYLFLDRRFSRILIVASGLLTLAAYITLNYFIVEADPWSSLFGYNYVDKPTHPGDYSYVLTLDAYVSFVLVGIKGFSQQPGFFMFCALAITGAFLTVPKVIKDQRLSQFRLSADLFFSIMSCVAYFAIHFALFPKPWIRFYAAQYMLVAVIVIWVVMILAAENRAADGVLK